MLRYYEGAHVREEDIRNTIERTSVSAVQDGRDGYKDRHFETDCEGRLICFIGKLE